MTLWVKPFLFAEMGIINRFMRLFFFHFYHTFAWTYDFISLTVSIGRWNDWIRCVLPFVRGKRVLEIGFGPGHLQQSLRDGGWLTVGLDESKQMADLARDRLRDSGYVQSNLVRGLAQRLPFPSNSFETVVSTFPAEYIFDSHTLSEVYRILQKNGIFLITPVAWITGRALLDRLAAWTFHITGESPPIKEIFTRRAVIPLENAGFKVNTRYIEIRSSLILLVTATK